MTDPKEQARQQIAELVQRFSQLPESERSHYNEAQMRQSFILPLFKALGWDIENPREMTAEERISKGYVDFGFYLNGIPVFYLETKKITAQVEKPEWAWQAINYSWLKGVTWAVLTDFSSLYVFNSDWRELPIYARFLDLSWERYATEDFEYLWLLSKQSMQAHEIDRFAERIGAKRKRVPVKKPTVTEALFSQMTEWRRALFTELRGFNDGWRMQPQVIDEAVQVLIDRLIFIRTMEDREIEANHLNAILRQHRERGAGKRNIFADLKALFRELDKTYNARLFAPHALDEMEMHAFGLIETIIEGLYTVKGGYAQYDFHFIDADVLGAVYEQYLSFRTLDPEGTQAIDLTKRAKRKSQGIYYTPQFVVRYIVQQTLGKLLEEGTNPYKIRVLDPACGSGSFLIEAFDVLDRFIEQHGTIDDHDNPRERRLRILRENLFGVDLDPQAVEVARLNLLLRAADHRGLLPMLDNIRVGNSLIDDPEVAGEVAFNWGEQFPEVMADGGFDVVIGNPPYIRMEGFKEAKPYLRTRYTVHSDRLDLYGYFIERELALLKAGGRFGMIVSNKFLRAKYGDKLRRFMTQQGQLESIVDLAGLPVFPDATVRTVIMTAKKSPGQKTGSLVYAPVMPISSYKQVESLTTSLHDIVAEIGYEVPLIQLQGNWRFARAGASQLFDKLTKQGVRLEEYLSPLPICRGVVSGLTAAFIIDSATQKKILEQNPEAEAILKPVINGRNIRQYHIDWEGQYLIYTFHGVDIARYPIVEAHLKRFQEVLEKRATSQAWYELQQPQLAYAKYMDAPKIIFPDIATTTRFALDTVGYYGTNTTYFLPTTDLYLLGILNSKVSNFYFVQVCAALEGTGEAYLRFFGQYLQNVPIVKAQDKQRNLLVTLVERMIDLKKRHAEAETQKLNLRHDLVRQIEQLDREIDGLVYDLYGLTEEEIAIIEGQG